MKLANSKHEAFAAALARGENASRAYVLAGFAKSRQNAHRMSSRDYIRQRVQELIEQPEPPTKIENRDPETGQFLPGFKGGGRPKGSRNKLAEAFIADLHTQWEKSGKQCLERVASDDPSAFLRVVAGILPREIDATLSVDSDFLAGIKDFHAAWQMARKFIGAEDAPNMIELQPVEATDE